MIKWGIIGLGNIANVFAEAIKETNNAKVQSISSLDKNRLDTFKNKFEIDDHNCHSSYNAVIENDTVDIIYIALPN